MELDIRRSLKASTKKVIGPTATASLQVKQYFAYFNSDTDLVIKHTKSQSFSFICQQSNVPSTNHSCNMAHLSSLGFLSMAEMCARGWASEALNEVAM